MSFGFSRDDAGRQFIVRYLERKIFPRNPFETIDVEGVGRLMELAVREGRKRQPLRRRSEIRQPESSCPPFLCRQFCRLELADTFCSTDQQRSSQSVDVATAHHINT
jgi:hypothetical protein